MQQRLYVKKQMQNM